MARRGIPYWRRTAIAVLAHMAPNPPYCVVWVPPKLIMSDHPDPIQQLRDLAEFLREARESANGMILARLATAETAALRALVEAEKIVAKEDLDEAGTLQAAIEYLTDQGYTVTAPDVN